MIDVTKTKFEPIALPGSVGGPRIGEPVPASMPKTPSGPVLANKTDAVMTPPAPAPRPAWVKEALGKLFVPTRAKAAFLLAGAALGGGMYAAKVFTSDPPQPAATAVLDVVRPDAAPVSEPPPLHLATLTPTPTLESNAPIPPLTLENIPAIAAPSAADQFRGRDVAAPVVPDIHHTASTSVTVPDLTGTGTGTTMPPLAAPAGFNTGPDKIDVPVLPAGNTGSGRISDPATVPAGGPGVGGSVVIPASAGQTGNTMPVASPPASSGTVAMPSFDIPLPGGVGGGATGAVTPPGVPPTATTPPAPITVSPAIPPVPNIPGSGGGSIGSGAVPPSPLPMMTTATAAGGFEPTRAAPVPTAPREPETSFDVDVHTVRQGDSYATISKTYYGNAAFADALRFYDESRPGRTAGTVHVPPVWVLRKRFPNAVRGDAGVTPAATVPAERTATTTSTGADWNASRGTTKTKTYATPRAMTMREVAKEAFGDELYWNRVWDLNLNLSTDAVLPQGTRIALPLDAKVGQ
jgi:hypothetical protein